MSEELEVSCAKVTCRRLLGREELKRLEEDEEEGMVRMTAAGGGDEVEG